MKMETDVFSTWIILIELESKFKKRCLGRLFKEAKFVKFAS